MELLGSGCTGIFRTNHTEALISDADQPLLPVRSEKPVPKELLADCMKVLKAVDVKAPVKRYDVIVENICGCGVNIVASDSVG